MSTIVGTNGAAGKRKASTAFVPDSISSYLMGCLRTNFEHLQHHINKDCAFAAAKTEEPAYIKQLLEELFRYLYLLGGDSSDGVIRSSPSYFVDQAFHCLMLDPVLYLRVCDEILTMHGKDATEVAVRVLPHDARGGQGEDEALRKARYINTLARYKETFGQDAPLALWTDYSDDSAAVRAKVDAQKAEAALKDRSHLSAPGSQRPGAGLSEDNVAAPALATSSAVARTAAVSAVVAAAPTARANNAAVVVPAAVSPAPCPGAVATVSPSAQPQPVCVQHSSEYFNVRIVGAGAVASDMLVTLDSTFMTICDNFAFLRGWDALTMTLTYKGVTPAWEDTLRMHNVKDGDEIHYVVSPPVAVKMCRVCSENYNDLAHIARETRSFVCYQDDLVSDAFAPLAATTLSDVSEFLFTLNGQFVPHDVTVGSLNLGDNDVILGRRTIRLLITDTTGKRTSVYLKCTSEMTYAIKEYAWKNEHRSVAELVRHKFMYQGVRIKNSDSPISLEMMHKPVIYVFKPHEAEA